jgi:GDPmannose 4,6-dehydratase
VEAMYLMLQQDELEDFVIATEITTTVRDFIHMTFKELGQNLNLKVKEKMKKDLSELAMIILV